MSTLPLCLSCGEEVWLNLGGQWESLESGTTCPKTGGGHYVRRVVPDPEDTP